MPTLVLLLGLNFRLSTSTNCVTSSNLFNYFIPVYPSAKKMGEKKIIVTNFIGLSMRKLMKCAEHGAWNTEKELWMVFIIFHPGG